jgi:hypothetical protein
LSLLSRGSRNGHQDDKLLKCHAGAVYFSTVANYVCIYHLNQPGSFQLLQMVANLGGDLVTWPICDKSSSDISKRRISTAGSVMDDVVEVLDWRRGSIQSYY